MNAPTELFPNHTFTEEDIRQLQPAMKVGILATVNPAGLPHLTLISTLMASSAKQVAWGQFMEGASKANVLTNPKTGFLIMTLDKHLWRGAADFTATTHAGKDYDYYNNTPLFRYNAYFGVHTVYNMDLVGHSGRQMLPMNRIIFAAVQTMIARLAPGGRSKMRVMNSWTKAFFAKIDNLKFLAYVGAGGYPVIIPVVQAQPFDGENLIFSLGAYRSELSAIPTGTPVAMFGMALTMEDVLVRGTFQGIRRRVGVPCGSLKIDWVYNSMPPTPMQIYPQREIEAVREF